MKKIILLLPLFVSFVSFSQYYPPVTSGNLNIFSENGSRFFIYLNGVLQNNEPQVNIRIENLNQLYYNVKIVFENKELNDITKKHVSVIGRDGVTFEETTYKINIDGKKKKAKMNFFSGTPIIPDFIPPSDVFVIGRQDQGNSNVNINNGINININTNSNNKSAGSNPDYKGQRKRKCLEMPQIDFQNALNSIKKESFDDAKLAVTQNIILNNCLSTNQIKEISKNFSFSQNQMTFVKNAYAVCVDVNNYYLIKDAFAFQIDQDEFMKFINFKSKKF